MLLKSRKTGHNTYHIPKGNNKMTEETAIRIAEALEGIDGVIRVGIIVAIGFGVAFWIIAMFKN